MSTLLLVAADSVVVAHLLWIFFLVFGALPGSRWPWVKWTHLAALVFSIALQSFSWVCPLTHLEIWLRHLSGVQPYEGTFIRHYIEQVVYARLPPFAVILGTLVVLAVSLSIYFVHGRFGRFPRIK